MQTKSIEPLLSRYLQVLKEGNPDEIYKWRALKNFKANWNLGAQDFGAMFDASLQAESNNLWASSNYYPKGMILEFCRMDQEKTRGMFRDLLDEGVDLAERIHGFLRSCDEFVAYHNENCDEDDRWKHHYHKPESV